MQEPELHLALLKGQAMPDAPVPTPAPVPALPTQPEAKPQINFDEFAKVDLRVGTVAVDSGGTGYDVLGFIDPRARAQ